jgi:hypothetical protein
MVDSMNEYTATTMVLMVTLKDRVAHHGVEDLLKKLAWATQGYSKKRGINPSVLGFNPAVFRAFSPHIATIQQASQLTVLCNNDEALGDSSFVLDVYVHQQPEDTGVDLGHRASSFSMVDFDQRILHEMSAHNRSHAAATMLLLPDHELCHIKPATLQLISLDTNLKIQAYAAPEYEDTPSIIYFK